MTLSPPRNDLVRMATAPVEVRDEAGDGRTLVGYPIVFNEWTEINSFEGNFLERIGPKSLTKTLAERGDQIKILFNHGMDPQIGDKPLGKPSVMQVDDRGLHLEVPLSATSYNQDIAALVRDGAIDGMSFRFGVIADTWENKDGRSPGLPKRTITEMSLREMGPVTFPAYAATEVGIRSRHDFEEWRGLDDEKRSAIAEIVRGTEAVDDTSAAAESDEPTVAVTRATSRNERQALASVWLDDEE